MKKLQFFLLIAFCVFIAIPAGAACTPCNVTYSLTVRYRVGIQQLTGVVTGSAQVSDGTVDLNAAAVQPLVFSQLNASGVLLGVTQISLNGGPPGASFAQNDTLVAANGGVIAWVNAPNSASARLHFTTAATNAQAHPFTYVYTASGTESPQVTFNYTMTASGQETYRAPAHVQQDIAIAYFLPSIGSGPECRHIEGDVCLPAGSKRTSKSLVETGNGSSTKIDNTFIDSGDRCAHFRIEVSSTSVTKKMCNGSKDYNCSHCGAWYSGRVSVDGYTETLRPWTRSITGSGQAEGKPAINFTVNYATANGALGSGLPDFIAISGSPSYSAALSNCKVGGTPIACSNLGTSINGNVLTVSTVYAQPASTSKNGSNTLTSTDGTKSIDSLPFTTENNDVRHFADVTFQGTTYKDLNGDGFTDAGPFSLWSIGANSDQLVAAFDRSGIPVATILSITPNPALLGQTVTFTGQGSGPFTSYQWFTHRLSQPIGNAASFTRNDLAAGVHQIRFKVSGPNDSPFTYATLTVNQPPVAFIHHIENVNDAAHPLVSLLLHDGAQTDPFSFDGGGIDFDGTVATYEWTSDIEPGHLIGTTAQFQKSLTALGTHTISYRVQDNLGSWSTPVKQTVVVRRPPVLLVHGICGDAGSWDEAVNNSLLGPQWATGDIVRRTFDANGDGVTNDSPADNAQVVYQTIQQMKQTYGVRKVNLVVHSMGGLDSRAYIQSPAYQGDVNKLVMLATPNHGSTIADLALITNGYSPQDVELYIPGAGVQAFLLTLGIVVDIVDWISPTSTIACLGQDSPGLHALRPHSDFLRNLNQTYKDDGTEDFGASNQPNDHVPSDTQYFAIHGAKTTVSHTHLPNSMILAIRAATGINLAHTALIWARDGDSVVTSRSVRLDGVPSAQYNHGHMRMEKEGDSVGKARDYLLDDPPPPERDTATTPISTAHLLGAGRATLKTGQTLAPVTLNVDGAAQRLRVSVSWTLGADPMTKRVGVAPSLIVVLTSPAGVVYSSDASKPGFTVTNSESNVEAAIDNPPAGAWKLEVRNPPSIIPGRNGLPYTWLAFEESGAFVALGLTADNVQPGDAITIAAYVQNNGTGVTGADVKGAVSNGKEKPSTLTFAADSRYAGLYTAKFTPPASGTFRILTAAKIPGNPTVTRYGLINIESRLLPDLTISLTGTTTNLTAKAENRGKGAATKIPVRIFDGPPADKGRLLAERVITLAPASTMTIAIPWSARPGVHTLFAIIDPSNSSGETNTSDNVAKLTIEAKDTTPPVARAGADQTAAVGQPIILDGRASTDDDRIDSYHWSVIVDPQTRRFDGTPPFYSGSYIAFPAFQSEGTYTIRLTVTDPSGNSGSDDLLVRVVKGVDTQPPVANAGPDQLLVRPGEPVKFNGLGSKDNYGIAYASWDVDISRDSDGDGNPANDQDLVGLTPTLAGGYARPGTYTAKLTVRDAAGNGPSTDLVVIKVGIPDTGIPIPGSGTTPPASTR